MAADQAHDESAGLRERESEIEKNDVKLKSWMEKKKMMVFEKGTPSSMVNSSKKKLSHRLARGAARPMQQARSTKSARNAHEHRMPQMRMTNVADLTLHDVAQC